MDAMADVVRVGMLHIYARPCTDCGIDRRSLSHLHSAAVDGVIRPVGWNAPAPFKGRNPVGQRSRQPVSIWTAGTVPLPQRSTTAGQTGGGEEEIDRLAIAVDRRCGPS
jgi:hypothetical protein